MSEELQQEASASLSAGFDKIRGTETAPPVKTETTESEQAPAAEAKPEEEAAPAATPEPTAQPEPSPDDEEIFPGMTKGQAKELLAKVPDLEKANRRLNGKIGELVGVIKQNQTAAAQPGAEGAPARRLQADAFKKLQGEGFTDLAEALAEDIGALLPQAHDPKQVEELVQARVDEALGKREKASQLKAEELLTRKRPTWKSDVVSTDFKLWLQGRPEDEQEEFDSTWDANVLAGYLTQFDKHRDSLKQQRQRTTARLEGAVVPKGDGGAATSKLPDSAGLAAGFHKVRRPSP